ncbi:hypothetical protein ACIQB5_24425 [Streptomyces sp. NPDC088560]|uniref:carbohydrate ABC transporter permease n=1 Tax=Streptomyces sp. NPDC088560 TaxID=3365868 RepID=UPI0037F67FB3
MSSISLAAVSGRRFKARRAGVGVIRPGFVWAVPATVFFLLFAILPLVLVAVLAFTSWDGITSPHFNGTANWTKLIHDPVMTQSIWLTLVLTALGVVTQTPVSILLGVWAAGPQRNRAVLSAIFFVPLLLSATAVSVLWRALLDPNFGLPGQLPWLFGNGNLLGSQAGSIAVLTFVGMWQFTPLHALLYQGGARAIPQVLYQAASIDGAGTVRQFEGVDLAAGTPHRDAIVPPSTVFTPTTPTRGPKGIAIWRYNGHGAVDPVEDQGALDLLAERLGPTGGVGCTCPTA